MPRPLLSVLLTLLGISVTITCVAQSVDRQRHVRARPPRFDPGDVARVFFDDVFARLVGERPGDLRNAPVAATSPIPGAAARKDDTSAETIASGWSRIISAASLEDEIKSLKLSVDKTVTTPSSFAGRGHQTARQDFTLLAVLFAVIDQYDGEVRWVDSAAPARDLFARTASNLKAGGSIQVYNEAKKRKQDLDDLVRGSRLQGTGNDDAQWGELVDRAPLMELLESRLEANLKRWTASGGELRAHQEEVVREAELTATIAGVLRGDGMDDAEEAEYRSFAESLQRGAVELARAAKSLDEESSREAMATVSRTCVDCHDIYR